MPFSLGGLTSGDESKAVYLMSHGPVGRVKDEAEAVAALMQHLKAIGKDDDESVDLSITSETNFVEAVERASLLALEYEMKKAGVDALVEKLKKRAARHEKRIKTIREGLAEVFAGLGRQNLETPSGTVFLKRNPASFEVVNEAQVSREYRSWEIDKAKLKTAYADWHAKLEDLEKIPDEDDRADAIAEHMLTEPGGGKLTPGKLSAQIKRD